MRNCSYRRLLKEILTLLAKEGIDDDVKAREVEHRIERIAKEQIHPASVGYFYSCTSL